MPQCLLTSLHHSVSSSLYVPVTSHPFTSGCLAINWHLSVYSLFPSQCLFINLRHSVSSSIYSTVSVIEFTSECYSSVYVTVSLRRFTPQWVFIILRHGVYSSFWSRRLFINVRHVACSLMYITGYIQQLKPQCIPKRTRFIRKGPDKTTLFNTSDLCPKHWARFRWYCSASWRTKINPICQIKERITRSPGRVAKMIPNSRMHLWSHLCTLSWLACKVRVTADDSGLYFCVPRLSTAISLCLLMIWNHFLHEFLTADCFAQEVEWALCRLRLTCARYPQTLDKKRHLSVCYK